MTVIDAQTRSEIIEAYNHYAEGIDTKNWPLVRSCFAEEVFIDYGETGAATGGAGATRKAEDWLSALQSVINGFDVTRHTITNHRFRATAEGIECRAYFNAEHIIFNDPEINHVTDDESVFVIGEYTNVFCQDDSGWKISKSKLVAEFTKGNIGLFVTAGERAAKS